MDELVRRMAELMRSDPTLALYEDPFPLKGAGLKTKDLPESWDFGNACRAFQEAKRILQAEARGERP